MCGTTPWTKPVDHCVGSTEDLVKLLVLLQLCWLGLSPFPTGSWVKLMLLVCGWLSRVPAWSWVEVVGHSPWFR